MRAAKVQASLRIRAVLPEPPPLTHTSCESRGAFRQKTKSLGPLNGWARAVKICHDGMLEDTNSLDAPQIYVKFNNQSYKINNMIAKVFNCTMIQYNADQESSIVPQKHEMPNTVKLLKVQTPKKKCCNYPKIGPVSFYCRVMA